MIQSKTNTAVKKKQSQEQGRQKKAISVQRTQNGNTI
jgi:hypothetical protein